MEANKIILNNQTLIDLTQDDVLASDVTQGKWVHLASGERVQGTNQGGGTAFAPDFKVRMTDNSNSTMDLTGLDTSNMSDMGYMLRNNENVTELDLSAFVTGNAATMECMLEGCYALQTLRLGIGFVTTNANVTGMFNSCYALSTIYYTGTTTQFNTNCANMIQELAENIGTGRSVTVHCSDGDITIQGQTLVLVPSLIGVVNGGGWDTDQDFTDLGNNTWQYNGVQLSTQDNTDPEDNTEFKIRFGGSWSNNSYGYDDQGIAVNWVNGADSLFQDGTTSGYGFKQDGVQFRASADGTVNITITTDGGDIITSMTIEKVTT